MIKEYENGAAFIEENAEYLRTNEYLSAFFFYDAKYLDKTDKTNFVIKAEDGEKKLLAMKLTPFNLMLFGNKELLSETLSYLLRGGYEFGGVLCAEDVGEELIEISEFAVGKRYRLSIGMDFMETKSFTEPSCEAVETPTEKDVDVLYEYILNFFADCGLKDTATKEAVAKMINRFRVIRADGKIVAMAGYGANTDNSERITHVYTVPEYRGKGYAKKVVNFVKNEILSHGKTATLNVDKKNPVSYHLYETLGFKKVFSQGVYEEMKGE